MHQQFNSLTTRLNYGTQNPAQTFQLSNIPPPMPPPEVSSPYLYQQQNENFVWAMPPAPFVPAMPPAPFYKKNKQQIFQRPYKANCGRNRSQRPKKVRPVQEYT
mmetsp:Transcript_16565/g.19068  ORF Transcript_16565/g.19068 Transcript_16565/m.19068 type:complete len:104 (+) Transcript_16565:461-772(+)